MRDAETNDVCGEGRCTGQATQCPYNEIAVSAKDVPSGGEGVECASVEGGTVRDSGSRGGTPRVAEVVTGDHGGLNMYQGYLDFAAVK